MAKAQEPPKENRLEEAAEDIKREALLKTLNSIPEQVERIIDANEEEMLEEVETFFDDPENEKMTISIKATIERAADNEFYLDDLMQISRQPAKFRHGKETITLQPELFEED